MKYILQENTFQSFHFEISRLIQCVKASYCYCTRAYSMWDDNYNDNYKCEQLVLTELDHSEMDMSAQPLQFSTTVKSSYVFLYRRLFM